MNLTLVVSIYQVVLPLFKKCVMLFQKEEPLLRKVYLEQIDVVHTFFGKLRKTRKTKSDILPNKMLFVDIGAKKRISKLGEKNKIVSSFFQKLRKCYLACAKYI